MKWFYWYKNFWDEVLLLGLLNYVQKKYNPDKIVIEVWNLEWIQNWIIKNKNYLIWGIIDKIEFVENKVISKRFVQILSFLWINKYKKYFKIFWWWEVLDESRDFPHDGWNLMLLHHYSIRKGNFILVWWIWTSEKKWTKFLFNHLLPKAQSIICRENISYERCKKYNKNTLFFQDFSKEIFLWDSNAKNEYNWTKYILINISPKYFTEKNLNKIKKYIWNHSSDCKKIFFPADINIDKELFTKMRKNISDLEIYDRTKHDLSDTIDLFKNSSWWIWSRLHFLYPLNILWKSFEIVSDSDKVKKFFIKTKK